MTAKETKNVTRREANKAVEGGAGIGGGVSGKAIDRRISVAPMMDWTDDL
jgi:hypothetical protein